MQDDVEACLVGPPQNAATYVLMARRYLSSRLDASQCQESIFLLPIMHTPRQNSTVARSFTQCGAALKIVCTDTYKRTLHYYLT